VFDLQTNMTSGVPNSVLVRDPKFDLQLSHTELVDLNLLTLIASPHSVQHKKIPPSPTPTPTPPGWLF